MHPNSREKNGIFVQEAAILFDLPREDQDTAKEDTFHFHWKVKRKNHSNLQS